MVSLRLPSLGDVAAAAQRAARRFPLVLAAGVVTAIAGILLIDSSGDDEAMLRLLAAASPGLALNFGLTVFAERRARSRAMYWLIAASGVAILVAFWYAWPTWSEPVRIMRYAQLSAGAHLFVAFAPFIGHTEPNAFWQYNRILFLRFLAAGLYAAVLWIGLSVALLALDKLLGVPVPEEGYGRLWMVLTFVFNPWFFVAGIPEDFGSLERLTDYPRGLRAFTQYVLVPIVAIYLVILTLYLGKVVVTREWPSGWIGYLVSGVAAVGILSWLLVRPLEERAEHAWVKTFTRGFYIALMPAIVMLWLAIWKRVEQYGITERRYFLIILSLWLAGIAVYYTISRSRNIKVIPATLCALAVLGFAGPWSAYSVSRANQTQRLASVLERNGLLANGELRPAVRAVPDSDAKAIRAGLRYLIETHGRRSVDRWIGESLRTRVSAIRGGNVGSAELATVAIMRALDMPPPEPSYRGTAGMFRYSVRRRNPSVDISGYRYAIQLTGSNWRDSVVVADNVVLRGSADSTALFVTRRGTTVLDISLVQLIDSLLPFESGRANQVPERLMTIESRDRQSSALVRLTNIAGMSARPRRITSISGEIYLRVP
jgi:hypothetical protein